MEFFQDFRLVAPRRDERRMLFQELDKLGGDDVFLPDCSFP